MKKALEPNLRFYFVMLVTFCAITFFFGQHNREIAIIEAGVIVLLFIYSRLSAGRRSREIVKYIESVTYNVDTATKDTLLNFPLPMAIFTLDGDRIILRTGQEELRTGQEELRADVKILKGEVGRLKRDVKEIKMHTSAIWQDIEKLGDRMGAQEEMTSNLAK